jgi:hypothetical protein
MMSSDYKQMSVAGRRTTNAGEIQISWRQETQTKLACAELEQKNITTFALQADLAK